MLLDSNLWNFCVWMKNIGRRRGDVSVLVLKSRTMQVYFVPEHTEMPP